jgi:hypothetical protein
MTLDEAIATLVALRAVHRSHLPVFVFDENEMTWGWKPVHCATKVTRFKECRREGDERFGEYPHWFDETLDVPVTGVLLD